MTVVGDVTDSCLQVIVVTADGFTSTGGKLSVYTREEADLSTWDPVTENVVATLGATGIVRAVDDSEQTPVGSFPLGQTFGHIQDAGISFGNYFVAEERDRWDTGWKYWLSKVAEGKRVENCTYNTHIQWDDGEDEPEQETERIGPTPDNEDDPENFCFDLAVFVDHNPDNVPGLGCAIFLHCDDDEHTPTWDAFWHCSCLRSGR